MDHWSQNALTVKALGVNAIVFIPLIVAVCTPKFLFGWACFGLTLTYFLIVENWLGMQTRYLPHFLRFNFLGRTRSPKTTNFDI